MIDIKRNLDYSGKDLKGKALFRQLGIDTLKYIQIDLNN